jgi:hypothetical protein
MQLLTAHKIAPILSEVLVSFDQCLRRDFLTSSTEHLELTWAIELDIVFAIRKA